MDKVTVAERKLSGTCPDCGKDRKSPLPPHTKITVETAIAWNDAKAQNDSRCINCWIK